MIRGRVASPPCCFLCYPHGLAVYATNYQQITKKENDMNKKKHRDFLASLWYAFNTDGEYIPENEDDKNDPEFTPSRDTHDERHEVVRNA